MLQSNPQLSAPISGQDSDSEVFLCMCVYLRHAVGETYTGSKACQSKNHVWIFGSVLLTAIDNSKIPIHCHGSIHGVKEKYFQFLLYLFWPPKFLTLLWSADGSF